MRLMPPLNPLRAFEAAARHESFTAAALEMHVTPGAVSRQIQVLEEFIGVSLFERANRNVTLTEAGRSYLANLAGVFDQIKNATRAVTETRGAKRLHIWSSMTFTLRWLVPRLTSFHAAHPDSEVIFSTSLKPVEFSSNSADIAIRIGTGDWPGLVSERLMSLELTPVCSPSLMRGSHSLKSVTDLVHHPLLHSSIQPEHWADWLNFVGAHDLDARRGMMFESVSLAYQAAIEGVGVAMGQLALVADDLDAGRLVAPFQNILNTKTGFYLIYPPRLKQTRLLQDFRDWLLEQAQKDQAARVQKYGLKMTL